MPAIIPIGVINAVKSIIQSFITFTILKELGASKANKEPIPKNKYKGIAIITIAIINSILNIFQNNCIFILKILSKVCSVQFIAPI